MPFGGVGGARRFEETSVDQLVEVGPHFVCKFLDRASHRFGDPPLHIRTPPAATIQINAAESRQDELEGHRGCMRKTAVGSP